MSIFPAGDPRLELYNEITRNFVHIADEAWSIFCKGKPTTWAEWTYDDLTDGLALVTNHRNVPGWIREALGLLSNQGGEQW